MVFGVTSALGQSVLLSYSVIVDVISNPPLVCGKLLKKI